MATNSTHETAEARQNGLWTGTFLLLCVTMALGYSNQAILQPTIPLFVDKLGGSALVAGLALLTFSIPSISIRPYLGRLADRWNSAAILSIGLLFLAVGGLIPIVAVMPAVFVAAVVRGIGWGGLNTGGYATLAAAAPADRRGEAAGYYTSFTSSPQVFWPAIALWLIDGPTGFSGVFVVATLLPLLAVPLGLRVARAVSIESPAPNTASAIQEDKGFIDSGVLLATAISLSSTLAGPAVTAFLPLYARSQGIGDIGLFYVVAGLTSITIRPLLGKRSDSLGRGPSIALGLTAQLLGFVLILFAQGIALILAGAICYSLGMAMSSAATTALAMDLANPQSRGKSMATFSMSFQLGAGVGAVLAGALADASGYQGMYLGAIAINLVGFALLAFAWRRMPRLETRAKGGLH